MTRSCVTLLVALVCLPGAEAARAQGDAPAASVALRPIVSDQSDLVAQWQRGLRIKRLDNGMVLMTKENHAAPVASAFVAVRAGAFLEQEYLACGISHLAEHLVSGGSTTTRTEDQIQDTLDEIGAVTNAYTSTDRTAYFIDTTPDHIGTAIDLLADYMQNGLIRQEEFNREFGVVQREILTGAADVDREAWHLLSETMFPEIPQGLRVIGYYENIQKLTRDDVWRYYKRMYTPSNAVMCVSGDFDGAAVMAHLEKAFGGWKGPHVAPAVLPEPSPPAGDVVAVRDMDTRLARVHVAFHSCRLSHPDLYPLDVLANILGRGLSSRLAADLKVKRSLVYGISASNYTPSLPGGQFMITFTCDPDKVDVVRRAVAEHLARACEESPSAEELAKVKKQVVAELLLDARTATAQARDLAGNQLSIGDPLFSARYVENFQKVTADDVLRAARKYLRGTPAVTAIVRPKADAGEGPVQVEAAPKPTTTRIVFPKSGLTLLVYRTPGQPAVSMMAAMKAGQSIETADTAGISALAARYLTRGTTTRSEEEIARFFESRGGSISAESGWNSLYVEALVLNPDFAEAMEVFRDVVLRPAFRGDLMDSTRERQLAALKATMADAFGEGALYFGEQFFQDSPYRFPPTGTEASLKNMAVEDVRDFYRRIRAGRNMVLGVAGDVDPADVEKLVGDLFADLEAGQAVEAPSGIGPRKTDDVEIYVKKTDKPGATVFVGYGGVDLYNHRDGFPMEVFDTVCSGYQMPGGWLHQVLRGQSLVYAVHFVGRQGLLPGFYRSMAVCQPDKATRVARLLVDLVHSGRDYTYTADDLRRAKSTILAVRQLGRQTPEQVAFTMILNELYGLGYDFEAEYAKRLEAVTAEDVHEVVNRLIGRPVVCITTPNPELVDMDELRLPFDAERLARMRAETPAEVHRPRAHAPPQ